MALPISSTQVFFADNLFWCDDEQLSSIYGKALLGTNKDSPRELDGVIPYNAHRDNLSNVEIFSKLLLEMDHDI